MSGGPLTISDCSSSYIYVLAHAKYTSVVGCNNCLVVVGATSSIVTIDNCGEPPPATPAHTPASSPPAWPADNCNFVGCCDRVIISNTTDSKFHVLANSAPILHGGVAQTRERCLPLDPRTSPEPEPCLGDNRGVQIGPLNTFYGKMEQHIHEAAIYTYAHASPSCESATP